MAIDTADLKALYKMFNDEAFTQLKTFQQEAQMEDEHLSTVLGEVVKASISGSIGAYEAYNKKGLILAQITSEGKRAADIASTTSVRDAQSTKDLAVKTAQITSEGKRAAVMEEDANIKKQTAYTIIAKRKREQGVVESSGTLSYSNDKTSQIENQIELLKKQASKVTADTGFVGKQGTNMDMQVRHNCIIQAMDAAQGYNMGIGNAGLIPSQSMHTNFFVQNKALMLNAGVSFSGNDARFTPDGTTQSVTLGTYSVDVGTLSESSSGS